MVKIKNKKRHRVIEIKPKKKKQFFIKKFIFWLLFLCFSGVVFWILFFSYFTQVNSIVIITEDFNKEIINKIIENETSGKYLNIFPKKNFFLFPERKIIKKIKENGLLLEFINIKRIFPQKITVSAKGRKDVFIWQNQGKVFLIDKAGDVFLELNQDQKDEFWKKFVIINDEGSRPVLVGEKIISEELASFFINASMAMCQATGINFKKEVNIPSLVAKEARIEAENGWTLYLSTEQSLNRQAVTLKAFFERQLVSSGEISRLEYVDLRLKGRILYKLKAGEEKEGDKEEVKESVDSE